MAKAAKWWGVPPWVLYKLPAFWRNMALKMESDEAWAQEQFEKKARRKNAGG